MTGLIVLFLMCLAIALSLPWFWVRYLILAYDLGVTLFWVLLPPVHFMDRSIFHEMVVATLVILTILSGLPFFVRLCWAIHRKTCDFSVQNNADVAIAIVCGLILAFIAFLQLSYVLAGSSLILAHGSALSLAILVWVIRHPVARSFSIGIVALTVYSLHYPTVIQTAANQAAPKGYVMSALELSNLTFLSMPKFPHPTLHFEEDGKPTTLGWSYRHRAFLPIRH